jgi:hypothetical protein
LAKRVSHRGDSTNREAKRAKFMVKIARLDEEAAILKEQATVVKNKWLAWEMQRLVHQVEISPCTVIMGNILGRKISNGNTKISRINAI